jgi:kynurenine formamidase/ketosteroid isomerase-like protein
MPVYPGDPEVRIAPALTAEADGANVLSLALGSHSGTHADAPLHVGDGWAALDALPLSRFAGIAEIVDVRGVARGGAITAAQLAGIAPAGSPGNPGNPAKILLLHTGCAAAWGTDEYLKHPWLEAAAAQLIVDRGYRAVGLDALSVDPSFPGAPDGNPHGDPAGGGFPAHAILAENGCIIVENLTGLEQVQRTIDAGSDVEVFLFPLNIPGADGAPLRAVARPLPVPELQPTVPQQTKLPPVPQPTVLGALSREEVQEAADRLVAAFAATDTEAYFAAFSPEATFIFHPEAQRLGSRSAYRTLWDSWLAGGWRVLECRSSEQDIQLLGAAAVFSHRVATTVQVDQEGGRETSDERETIVFARTLDGGIVCVHEHLSACPADV